MSNVLMPIGEDVQTSIRMPKTLLKKLKRIALDNDISLAALALEAFEDVIKKYEKSNHTHAYDK
jgi:predicted DNA-binding protein